jgi:transcriptional regulator with XRE-family HTH domain
MTDRFKSLLEQLQLSPSEFADRIGVQRSSISHIISGRNKPSIDFLEKILNIFPEVDINWLITGKASSLKTSVNPTVDVADKHVEIKSARISDENNEKPPAPFIMEPVDQIIIVYKNNTFRILNPSDE